jgi:hypothetical protein
LLVGIDCDADRDRDPADVPRARLCVELANQGEETLAELDRSIAMRRALRTLIVEFQPSGVK